MAIGALRLCQLLPPALALLGRRRIESPRLRQQLLGLAFPNPLGLAAGFDKNGEAVPALGALGFGFLEVGTVTPRAQPGNPKPRVFRYPEAESLENALGFNNSGAASLARRLSRLRRRGVPLGVNLGKNRDTPLAAAEEDYERLVESLAGLCDYWVINVSSPNTPGLRDLQSGGRLADLLRRVGARTDLPVLVKLSPDLEPRQALELGRSAVEAGAAGLLLTNTTTDYSLLPGARRVGGLSGRVLRQRSFALLKAVASELFGACLLISVGGIDTAAEAYRRIRSGASLLQIYTALVFGGPRLVGEILQGLLELLDRDGLAGVGEAVGIDVGS